VKRRELFTGALAAAGGCAVHQAGAQRGSIPIADVVAQMDRGLLTIDDPFRSFVGGEAGRSDFVMPEAERELLVGSLGTLMVAGAIHDLPLEARAHPEIEARVASVVPRGARSLYGITQHLERMAPAERIMLQRGIARDPELPLRTAEQLDRMASSVELGVRSRYQLRSLATESAWRLSHQPVSLLLDETTARVRKAELRAGGLSEEQRMLLAARMQEEDEWEEESEYDEEEEEPAEEPIRERERRPWKGRGLAIGGGVGGILGLIGGYVSLVWAYFNGLANNSQAGPVTLAVVSGVTFVAGVIIMITGLVIKGRQDREWLERNPKPVRRRRRR
jgi:hypothetical protein